jgi:hypothetical protein
MVSRHCKITSDVIGTLAFKQKSALCQNSRLSAHSYERGALTYERRHGNRLE